MGIQRVISEAEIEESIKLMDSDDVVYWLQEFEITLVSGEPPDREKLLELCQNDQQKADRIICD